MRGLKLIGADVRSSSEKGPGFFRVERPRQLWQLDMTSVSAAGHGWTYLMAIIDCCTTRDRRLAARAALPRRRSGRSRRTRRFGVRHPPGELTPGGDDGSAFTAQRLSANLAELGIRRRRGSYRDPESQAFIESWFGKLEQREVAERIRDPRRRSVVQHAGRSNADGAQFVRSAFALKYSHCRSTNHPKPLPLRAR